MSSFITSCPHFPLFAARTNADICKAIACVRAGWPANVERPEALRASRQVTLLAHILSSICRRSRCKRRAVISHICCSARRANPPTNQRPASARHSSFLVGARALSHLQARRAALWAAARRRPTTRHRSKASEARMVATMARMGTPLCRMAALQAARMAQMDTTSTTLPLSRTTCVHPIQATQAQDHRQALEME